MVILDGKEVSDDTIDPSIHRFIGSFRKPYQLVFKYQPLGEYIYHCPCGNDNIDNDKDALYHYQMGHFDISQYITIKE